MKSHRMVYCLCVFTTAIAAGIITITTNAVAVDINIGNNNKTKT